MFKPGRLALARMRRRYSARILAEESGVSPVTLSRIENGKQEPDEETIAKLVRVLRYPRRFFFMADIDEVHVDAASFRSLTSMSARERDAALASGILALELADWVKARFNLPEPDLPDLGYQNDPAGAARTLRQYWSIGEKPIGHLIKLLESKGARVFALAENTRNVDAFSYWRNGEPFIFLNTIKSAERSRFDAAHELGHLVLHRHGGPQGREAEHQANLFASSFLMPKADVGDQIPYVTSLRELLRMKKRWGVSLSALVYRLHKLESITDWQYRSFCIQIERDFGSVEPDGLSRERSAIWQMVLTELWRDGITRHHIADALNLPHDEVDTLLFGLTGDPGPPNGGQKSLLKVV
jgi:Zn-dependent peptidase ImmA (M78 family)/DNA-binding XRE family transcriptional regulator